MWLSRCLVTSVPAARCSARLFSFTASAPSRAPYSSSASAATSPPAATTQVWRGVSAADALRLLREVFVGYGRVIVETSRIGEDIVDRFFINQDLLLNGVEDQHVELVRPFCCGSGSAASKQLVRAVRDPGVVAPCVVNRVGDCGHVGNDAKPFSCMG